MTLMGFTLKIKLASIFTFIFVISALKCVSIGDWRKSEVIAFRNSILKKCSDYVYVNFISDIKSLLSFNVEIEACHVGELLAMNLLPLVLRWIDKSWIMSPMDELPCELTLLTLALSPLNDTYTVPEITFTVYLSSENKVNCLRGVNTNEFCLNAREFYKRSEKDNA